MFDVVIMLRKSTPKDVPMNNYELLNKEAFLCFASGAAPNL